jgi:hypothetical protein
MPGFKNQRPLKLRDCVPDLEKIRALGHSIGVGVPVGDLIRVVYKTVVQASKKSLRMDTWESITCPPSHLSTIGD